MEIFPNIRLYDVIMRHVDGSVITISMRGIWEREVSRQSFGLSTVPTSSGVTTTIVSHASY